MKGKGGVGAVTIVVLVIMILFTGHATATAEFKTCFEVCMVGCFIQGGKFPCTVKCLASCIIRNTSDELYYCSLGCSVDQCAQFGD
ncbi:unnamed protein product, partial [Ilex paraguariensis]